MNLTLHIRRLSDQKLANHTRLTESPTSRKIAKILIEQKLHFPFHFLLTNFILRGT